MAGRIFLSRLSSIVKVVDFIIFVCGILVQVGVTLVFADVVLRIADFFVEMGSENTGENR